VIVIGIRSATLLVVKHEDAKLPLGNRRRLVVGDAVRPQLLRLLVAGDVAGKGGNGCRSMGGFSSRNPDLVPVRDDHRAETS